MKNIKRIIAAAIAVMMCLSVSGCSAGDAASGDAGGADTTAAYNGEGDLDGHAIHQDNSGVLSHTDGNSSKGNTADAETVFIVEEALRDESEADDTYPTGDNSFSNSYLPWDGDDAWLEHYNTEEYNSTTENSFKSAANNPLSTFSID
ncbi:MAG: hypothetical protein K2J76_04540, partial [Oscillospiraceae bacterium]|nr:hypothetical protein [Oscillospiraceae bacterium]